jgi:hypothetical protein
VSANQFERHGKARAKLGELFTQPAQVSTIHYSCESFYYLPDGRSPRITSIAVRKLDTAQTTSFSIHQTAELRSAPMAAAAIEPLYNELEKEMLDQFYTYLQNQSMQTFLHWNMRDKNYGFQAIEHRYRVLGGTPFVVPDDRKVDLSRLFIDLYGVGYIGHPRLENLLEKNHITARDFMTGKQEGDAFVAGKYVDLHRSTLRKVDVFCNLASRAYDDKLKTLATWREAHGLSWEAFTYLAKTHPIYTTLTVVGGAAGAIAGLVRLVQQFLCDSSSIVGVVPHPRPNGW